MEKKYRVLVINPGSTSTKIAVFEGEDRLFAQNLTHPAEEIANYPTIFDQYAFRRDAILGELKKAGFDLSTLDAVAGRGGLIRPVKGGTYLVNEAMKEDLKVGVSGQHASNLGGILADDIGSGLGIPAFITDPVVVDEADDVARVTGTPLIERSFIYHPLNQRAAARKAAAELGKRYDELNFIVAHLGGGVSVGAHQKGRIIDVNNALDGEGPFSPERAGGLPAYPLIDLCYSGKYTAGELKKMLVGKGGLVGYLGTNDVREVHKMIEQGDKRAGFILHAMAYQVAKEIGCAAAVLSGKVDAVVFTGGIAHDSEFISWVKERVSFIAPIRVYPGEFEMEALSQGAIRVLSGEEPAQVYDPAAK